MVPQQHNHNPVAQFCDDDASNLAKHRKIINSVWQQIHHYVGKNCRQVEMGGNCFVSIFTTYLDLQIL